MLCTFVAFLAVWCSGQTFLIMPKKLDSILKENNVIFHKEFTYLAFCESGFQNTNLFGMHHPYMRKTYSISQYGKVAKFLCIEDSIKDFLIWYNLLPAQEGDMFINFLKKRGYSPYEAYYTKLDYVIRQNRFKL